MKRIKIIGLIAAIALVAAACGGGDDESGDAASTDAATPGGTGTLADYGESTDADPALVEKAMGPGLEDSTPEIILASIARANQDLDQATIDKAMECWSATKCDTGTGGELTMGYADGGGLNVWRAVTRMEAILQALTYPDIGKMMFRDAQWDVDPAVAAGDIEFLIQAGVDFIIGYPDQGTNIADAILEAKDAGIPYSTYSAGWVGLPEQEGALIPGEDYLTVVGEDLCALGESFAEVINEGVGSGKVGVMGGTPGNALSLGWQQCFDPAVDSSIKTLGPADTYWSNDVALETVNGWLSTDPDIAGYAYEYADGLNTALQAYDDLDIPIDDLTVALRTDEQTLFCTWKDMDDPNFHIWYSAGGNFQSRVAVTASMMYLQGAEIPPEIVVPHVMREVTADDCNPDSVTPTVSGTSLVPDEVLALMYPEG
ncbi:MAG TPA: substrate-binding domain-containing protein [Actinomycetota bacterium]